MSRQLSCCTVEAFRVIAVNDKAQSCVTIIKLRRKLRFFFVLYIAEQRNALLICNVLSACRRSILRMLWSNALLLQLVFEGRGGDNWALVCSVTFPNDVLLRDSSQSSVLIHLIWATFHCCVSFCCVSQPPLRARRACCCRVQHAPHCAVLGPEQFSAFISIDKCTGFMINNAISGPGQV